MDFAAILHEIDAEIEKLQQIRNILAELSVPASPRKRTTQRAAAKPVSAEPEPEPRVIVLPPKEKREYRPRPRLSQAEPRALAAPVSRGPVFVPKTLAVEPAAPVVPEPATDVVSLEAAIRKSLLGGAA